MPPLYRRVYAVVRRIPRGSVLSYGQVAALAGAPGAARAVGWALRAHGRAQPPGRPVPWHRVIGAGGRISLPPLLGGDEQARRLRAEGLDVRDGQVRPGVAAPPSPRGRPSRAAIVQGRARLGSQTTSTRTRSYRARARANT